MTELFRGLLGRLEARDGLLVHAHELRRWPVDAHRLLIEAGVLKQGSNATGLRCDGCDEGCWVQPEHRRCADGTAHLVVPCTGRNPWVFSSQTFSPSRLATWQFDGQGLAIWLAAQLGLRGEVAEAVPGWAWSLGAGRFGGAARLVIFATSLVGEDAQERASVLRRLVGGRAALVLVPTRPLDLTPISVVALDRLIEVWPDGLALERDLLDLAVVPAAAAGMTVQARPSHRAPSGTSWAEVKVWLVDGDTVRIVVPGRPPRSFTAAELGLTNPRSRERRRTKGWAILEAVCEGHGTCSRRVGGIASYEAFKVQVSLLGRALRAFVGIEASPFHPTSRTDGVRAVFQAGPLPEPELYVGQDRWGA